MKKTTFSEVFEAARSAQESSRKVGTTIVTISADWSQASSHIMIKYADCGDEHADWETTGKQVSDFGHDENAALDYFCEQAK